MQRKFDSNESINFNDEVYEPEENLYNGSADNEENPYQNTVPKVKDKSKSQRKGKK